MDTTLPSAAFNSIFFLASEVLFQIIDDKCALDRSAQSTQILDESTLDLTCVLSVEPVSDHRMILVKFVQDEVCISLVRCREDNDLIQLGHISEEPYAKWSDFVNHPAMLEVDQSLIQVQHESILAIVRVNLVKGRRQ